MIGVANRESVGQRIMERDIASGQMRHRGRTFVRYPLIVLSLVPG